jgi:hypothetical protein
VDINTIRATNRYAEIDLEMKAKALETCAITGAGDDTRKRKATWHSDSELMAFLDSL